MDSKVYSNDDLCTIKSPKVLMRKIKSEGNLLSIPSSVKLSKKQLVLLKRKERNYGKLIANGVQDFVSAQELTSHPSIGNLFLTSLMMYTIESEQKEKRIGLFLSYIMLLHLINNN